MDEKLARAPVCGIGIYDASVLSQFATPYMRRIYMMWYSMLSRARPSYIKQRPSYAGTTIAPEFIHFADFAAWVVQQIGWDRQGFHLDKDILQKGNRTYGPGSCVFVPSEINSLLLKSTSTRGLLPLGVSKGRIPNRFEARCRIDGKQIHLGTYDDPESAFAKYKSFKEENIKRLAEQYRDQIDPRAYKALMEYKVEITD